MGPSYREICVKCPGGQTRMRVAGVTCYMAVTPERTLASVGECPLHIWLLNFCPFHFKNGRVTVVSILKPRINTAVSEVIPLSGSRSGLKNPLELLESSRYNGFSRRRRWAWL